MRVAALAIALPDRGRLAEQVVASCAVSHFTRGAISGAMAMAFALAAAMEDDATLEAVATAARKGAVIGRQHGDWSWSAPLEKRIDHVLRWVDDLPEEQVLANLFELIGVDMYGEQLVPDALGIAALAPGDPNRAMLLAANLGGDSDTLASLTGSLGGALWGIETIDPGWVERVEAVNGLDLNTLATRLVAFREGEQAPC